MKISQDFPNLVKANAILIVSGKSSAIVYKISNGELHERDSVKIEKPEYSDKEGFFEYGTPKNSVRSAGSAYEPKTEYLKKKFIKDLISSLSQIKTSYEDVYLFAPKYISTEIESEMPKKISNKLKEVISGNFTKLHPENLIKKIKSIKKEKKESVKKPVTTEVKKLLANKKKLKRSNL